MGIKDLWSKLLGDIKKKDAVPFSAFKGSIVGIDISVWLHRYCHSDTVALCMNSEPKYKPTELVTKFQINHRSLVDAGITPYYCFDGFRHPMKVVARKERDEKKNKAEEWLSAFYRDGLENRPIDDARRELAMRYLRDLTNPDELIVSCIIEWMEREKILYDCAPFEAEWQLVQLEKEGVVDAVMTTDGDAIILGAKVVLFDDDFSKSRWKVYRQEDILRGGSPISEYDVAKWPAIASMLGSDYHERIPFVGYASVMKVLPSLKDFEPETIASAMKEQYSSQWNKLPEDYDYTDSLSKSIALFKHAPVLDNENNMVPLNALEEEVSWGMCIGLGVASPAEVLPSNVREEDYSSARRFRGPTFISGRDLPTFETLFYTVDDNPNVPPETPLPRYARLDFEKVPICCLHSGVLQSFITARLGYGITGNREKLEKAVQDLDFLKKPILEPEKVPIQIGRWLVSEALEPTEGSDWTHDGYFRAIRECVETIIDSVVKQFYPRGNEHNRVRAMRLIEGGNVDFTTFEYRECKSRADGKRVLLFRSLCAPSMKTEVASANVGEDEGKEKGYILYLAFDSADGSLLPYPFSCCGCYDGRGCCSHQLAKLGVFRLIQHSPSQSCFEEAMPVSPYLLQNIPTLVESVAIVEFEKRSKAAKKRRLS